MEDAVQTVMTQCELWTDNMPEENPKANEHIGYYFNNLSSPSFAIAEDELKYDVGDKNTKK